MTTDPEQQAEFAAGLMGISVDEVRPHLRSADRSRRIRPAGGSGNFVPTARGTVLVERKARRSVRTW